MDIIKITGAAVVLMSSFMLGMYFVVAVSYTHLRANETPEHLV